MVLAVAIKTIDRFTSPKPQPDYSLEETLSCLNRFHASIDNNQLMHPNLQIIQKVEAITGPANDQSKKVLGWEHFGIDQQDIHNHPQVRARQTARFMIDTLRDNPEISRDDFCESLRNFLLERDYGRLLSKSLELRFCVGLIDDYIKHRNNTQQRVQKTIKPIYAPWRTR